MAPIDYALIFGLVSVIAALVLLMLLRPWTGEPEVKVHPENISPLSEDWRSQHVSERDLHRIMKGPK